MHQTSAKLSLSSSKWSCNSGFNHCWLCRKATLSQWNISSPHSKDFRWKGKKKGKKLSWRRCSWSHHFYDCALANDKLCGHSQLPCATLKIKKKKKKDTIIKWNSEIVIECFQWTIILVSSLLKKLSCVKDRPNHNIGTMMIINTALRDNINNYISVHPWCLQINLYKAGASQSKILPLSLL